MPVAKNTSALRYFLKFLEPESHDGLRGWRFCGDGLCENMRGDRIGERRDGWEIVYKVDRGNDTISWRGSLRI